ncbi:porin family protein [Moritella sp. 5]|uniref:porin family protein n=1 Tax=Moritella sp. 5 TaxID=2746231 RepID=UPI001BA884B0|nr:porin family protein [Moritella sp. 5]QUM80440.1 porin family protein [Moritella sp. 5]
MKSITVLGALAAIVLTTHVQANQDVSGFYIGGGLGSTFSDSDSNSFYSDTHGNTLKFIGGYQFNRIVAIETQYTKYGDVTPLNNKNGYKWAPTTLSLTANLGYTFQNGLRPFTTIGLSSLDLHQTTKKIDDSSATAARLGLGLEYTPATLSNINFRAGYEADAFTLKTPGKSDTDVILSSLYLAASYKF